MTSNKLLADNKALAQLAKRYKEELEEKSKQLLMLQTEKKEVALHGGMYAVTAEDIQNSPIFQEIVRQMKAKVLQLEKDGYEKLEGSKKEKQVLLSSLATMGVEKDNLEKEKKAQQEKIDTLHQRIEDLYESKSSSMNELFHSIMEKDSTTSEVKDALATANSTITSLKAENEKLKELEGYQEKASKLEEEKAILLSKIESLEKEVTVHLEENEKLKRMLDRSMVVDDEPISLGGLGDSDEERVIDLVNDIFSLGGLE